MWFIISIYISAKWTLCTELIERDAMLGGSWNSQWIEDKYWSENSPRVIPKHLLTTNHFIDFLSELGMYDADYAPVYGSLPTTISSCLVFS